MPELEKEDITRLTYMIQRHFWYQMYMDGLPIWAMLGLYKTPENSITQMAVPHLFTHKHFSIGYNGNQIIQVNLTSSNPVSIATLDTAAENAKEIGINSGQTKNARASVKMSYSVSWKETPIPFANRFDRYLDSSFFEHGIHWFSIFNSFMMVAFLIAIVVSILMRTLKQDIQRYDEESRDFAHEDDANIDFEGK